MFQSITKSYSREKMYNSIQRSRLQRENEDQPASTRRANEYELTRQRLSTLTSVKKLQCQFTSKFGQLSSNNSSNISKMVSLVSYTIIEFRLQPASNFVFILPFRDGLWEKPNFFTVKAIYFRYQAFYCLDQIVNNYVRTLRLPFKSAKNVPKFVDVPLCPFTAVCFLKCKK